MALRRKNEEEPTSGLVVHREPSSSIGRFSTSGEKMDEGKRREKKNERIRSESKVECDQFIDGEWGKWDNREWWLSHKDP